MVFVEWLLSYMIGFGFLVRTRRIGVEGIPFWKGGFVGFFFFIYNVALVFLQQSDSAIHFSFSDSQVILTPGAQLLGCVCLLRWSAK